MFRALVAAVTLPLLAAQALAGPIVCRAQDHKDVVLERDAGRMLGRTVSCIRGDFLVDLTPCAPVGAWGLSAPTGVAPLVAITRSRAQADAHLGGVTRHWRTASEIGFEGGFRGSGETSDAWSFVLDRRSGKGVLRTEEHPPVPFACSGSTVSR